MYNHRINLLGKITLLITFNLSLVACGGGGGSGSDAPADTTDTTAPTVSSTTPAASATSVARNSAIIATFDEDIFATTVDASSFALAGSGSINGVVTFDGVANIATFTPSSDLSILATYTATLSAAITDLSGNSLATDYSWSFTTAEGTWGTAELIEIGTPGIPADAPHVAVDGSGNAIAVWSVSDGAVNNIWANRFDGTSWGTAEKIENEDLGDAIGPRVAFDNSGNAIAVWEQNDGVVKNIWANRFDGTSWGTAEKIENDVEDADNPQIAFDNSGNAIAVWTQLDNFFVYSIMANRFDGTSWGTAEKIENYDSENTAIPQVAFDNSGNAIAVWEQNDGVNYNVWANRFNGTSWGTAEQIGTDNAVEVNVLQVAVDSSGNAIAVWDHYDGVNYNVWENRFNGTSWGTAELLENDAGYAGNPRVAFDNSGNAIAVWGQSDGAVNNIWANRFNGTSWGTAEKIENDDLGGAFSPQVAFDNSGNAIAVWFQDDGANFNIMANRFNGTSWGSAELIETENPGIARDPQVAFDNSGNAIAVWRQNSGGGYKIWANRFK